MKRNIIIIQNRKFLVQSQITLGKYINFLGFWETNGIWNPHVSSFNILKDQEYLFIK